MFRVGPVNYVVANVAPSQLPAKVIYLADSKTTPKEVNTGPRLSSVFDTGSTSEM